VSDTNKVSEEELKSITDLGVKYNTIRDNFGQLRIQRLLIEQQLEQIVENEDKLEQDYIETQKIERELLESLNSKYGQGVLNPQTGEFTPRNTEEDPK
jgi:DNA repair exonuclease SbcCD ATPase subunit|tara:strand:+ start:267 stop:560 length:294 start_codon:yes stop_codon:yes gene_type:complete